MNHIAIIDYGENEMALGLVEDGARLDYGDNDVPYRVHKGPIGEADPAGSRT